MDLGILGALMRDEDVIPRRKFNLSCGYVAHFIMEVASSTCGRILFADDYKSSKFTWKAFPERLRTDPAMLEYYKKFGIDGAKNWNPIVIEYDTDEGSFRLYGTQNDSAAEKILTKLNFDDVNPNYLKDLERVFSSHKTPNKVHLVMVSYALHEGTPTVTSVYDNKIYGCDVKTAIEEAFLEGYSIGVGMRVYDSDCDSGRYDYNAIFMVKYEEEAK